MFRSSCVFLLAACGAPNIDHIVDVEQSSLGQTSSICDYHGSTTTADAAYTAFETSLVGPRGNSGLSLQNQVEKHEVGGASVVVIQNFQPTQVHYYGCRDRKGGARTTVNTLYHAASMSKAVAAMALTKASRLDILPLNTSVRSLANDYPNSLMREWVDDKFRGSTASYPRDITIRRLLNHSAGLDTHGIGSWEEGDAPKMRDILMGGGIWWGGLYWGGVEPILPPKTQHLYSGGGFIVAEHAIELVQGLAFKDFARQQVLSPAGLVASTFEKAQSTTPNLVRGCSRSSCNYGVLQTNVKAAGGLLTTASEYAQLVIALANRGVTGTGRRVLEESDVQTMLTPVASDRSTFKPCSSPGSTATVTSGSSSWTETCVGGSYREIIATEGLGVDVGTTILSDGYPRWVEHGGAQDGARSFFRIDRSSGKGFVVMINGERSWKDADGYEYGADPLISAIITAWDAAY